MQRIGAFNQLSSLFAHELGQPLYAIRCFCFALRKEINKTGTRSQEVLETVQDIEKQTVRADEIIQKTRNYLKKHCLQLLKLLMLRSIEKLKFVWSAQKVLCTVL